MLNAYVDGKSAARSILVEHGPMAGQQELAVALELLGDHKHLQRTKAVDILTGLFKGWFLAGACAELHP